MKIVAIIPARKSSKGLKNKNIYPLQGKPLINWTIESVLNSKFINDIYVTSDSDKIEEIALQYDINFIKRPSKLANDNSNIVDVIIHALQQIQKKKHFDYLILLQPTSPLRNTLHIDNAIFSIINSNATSLISVIKQDNKFLKSFYLENISVFLKTLNNSKFQFSNRQLLPNMYMPNGAIYIINIHDFLKKKSFFTNKCIPFIMPKKYSIDIDSYKDILKIEKIMKK
jgi:CMP-N,N'-diacetyllegionaminic acid synthase